MEVIQFPSPKDTLDFDGMGIKIDVKQQRESWNLTFKSVQIALGFCNLDHVEAEKAVCGLLGEGDLGDRVGADLSTGQTATFETTGEAFKSKGVSA